MLFILFLWHCSHFTCRNLCPLVAYLPPSCLIQQTTAICFQPVYKLDLYGFKKTEESCHARTENIDMSKGEDTEGIVPGETRSYRQTALCTVINDMFDYCNYHFAHWWFPILAVFFFFHLYRHLQPTTSQSGSKNRSLPCLVFNLTNLALFVHCWCPLLLVYSHCFRYPATYLP